MSYIQGYFGLFLLKFPEPVSLSAGKGFSGSKSIASFVKLGPFTQDVGEGVDGGLLVSSPGTAVGLLDGRVDGMLLNPSLGPVLGIFVGGPVGVNDGYSLGIKLGESVGSPLLVVPGSSVGFTELLSLGFCEGRRLGKRLGVTLGAVGVLIGYSLGLGLSERNL